jgi:hypothetical protein
MATFWLYYVVYDSIICAIGGVIIFVLLIKYYKLILTDNMKEQTKLELEIWRRKCTKKYLKKK